MYSTNNEGKSVVAERFIRTLKNKIYQHMIAISKNVYFNVSNDIGDKYDNTYHKIINTNTILIYTNILGVVLDLIKNGNLHLVTDLVETV